MNISQDILSQITVYSKYARYLDNLKRRETFNEIAYRNMEMHQKRYPALSNTIESVYTDYVLTRKVLPSMRSMQFGGPAIERDNNRMFNCAFLHAKRVDAFKEIMFLLLGGSGVGYSVQERHVNRLPVVREADTGWIKHVNIDDSIEGWADAVGALCDYYFGLDTGQPWFNYDGIRPKGSRLITSGGKAPGHEPLKECLEKMEALFRENMGRQLRPIQVHDLICFIADAVLSGGIRRAALISLFDRFDEEMLNAKSGKWWETHPWRARANNSIIVKRDDVDFGWFMRMWKRVEESGSGEPGIYWTYDYDWGTNPCAEIALQDRQFCNLTEINASTIIDQEDLNGRAAAASFIGTLQAGYTDFNYLSNEWKRVTDAEALIGVGATGIASNRFLTLDTKLAANTVLEVNAATADLIGINHAARTTCVKPSGTTSLVLGTSSGIHAWHSEYYVRRMRIMKSEALYGYLAENHPELVEDEVFDPTHVAVVSVPQAAPEGATTRKEYVYDLLTRVREANVNWVHPGHRSGMNTHNVSATVSVREGNWEGVGEWMWGWRKAYNGLTVLPADGGSYAQLPFEDITQFEYVTMLRSLNAVDLTKVIEEEDDTDLTNELACAGGACEVTYA